MRYASACTSTIRAFSAQPVLEPEEFEIEGGDAAPFESPPLLIILFKDEPDHLEAWVQTFATTPETVRAPMPK